MKDMMGRTQIKCFYECDRDVKKAKHKAIPKYDIILDNQIHCAFASKPIKAKRPLFGALRTSMIHYSLHNIPELLRQDISTQKNLVIRTFFSFFFTIFE